MFDMKIVLDVFEWDSDKGEANEEKHGITFEDAIELFDAPFLRLRSVPLRRNPLDRAR